LTIQGSPNEQIRLTEFKASSATLYLDGLPDSREVTLDENGTGVVQIPIFIQLGQLSSLNQTENSHIFIKFNFQEQEIRLYAGHIPVKGKGDPPRISLISSYIPSAVLATSAFPAYRRRRE